MKREEELTVSVTGLQTVSKDDLQEALRLLTEVMRPSMSAVIISAINEQAATIERMNRTSHARRLAFEAELLPNPKPEAEPVAYLTTRGTDQRLVLAKFVSDEERDVGSNGWTATPLYAHPPKPEPVGWETDAEWELEMRCANITEHTPFAEVSKLINDLWQQYCLAAEPKGVDHQVHHSNPVVSQNTQIVEDNATEGGAHDKGLAAACKALGHEGVYISDATLKRAIAAYRAALTASEGEAHEKGLRAHCESAASLFETLSEDLPDDDVSGIMMRVMAENIRKAIGGHADD